VVRDARHCRAPHHEELANLILRSGVFAASRRMQPRHSTRTPTHSRDAPHPSDAQKSTASKNRGRGECRVPVAPAASRAKKTKHTSVVTARFTGETRHSRTRMVLTVSFALSRVTGLVCHPRRRSCLHQLDTSVGASGPHDFAVRFSCARLAPPPRPPHPAPNVRDDRANAPHVRRDEVDIVLIWGLREAKYFFGQDWTGSIRLKRLEKLAFWRRAFASFLPSSGTCRSSPSVRYLFLQTLPKWCN